MIREVVPSNLTAPILLRHGVPTSRAVFESRTLRGVAVSARTSVSLFIIVVLALHALPVVSYQGARQTRWPFLVWAMYAQSYPPGPIQVDFRQLVAVSPDGARHEVDESDVGLSRPSFRNNYLAPLTRGDTTAGRWLVDRLNRLRPNSVTQVRIQTVRYRLVDGDPGVAVDTLPVVAYPISHIAER